MDLLTGTLYDQLKPEVLTLLESEKQKYPATTEGAIRDLMTKYCITHIKYETVIFLTGLPGIRKILDVPNYADCYMISSLRKIFMPPY